MDKITFIKATNPSRVCKTYTLTDGVLDKIAVANVIEGTAFPRQVDTAQKFMELLHRVTDAPDIAIIPGEFHGAGDARFNIVTEGELAKMMRTNLGEGPGGTPGGVQEINGSRVAARLRRGISPSAWFLVDADNPPGIPDEWRGLSIQQRLEMFDPVIAGFSKCERIELRASSARVHKEGEEPGQATHAWIRVSDPEKIEVLRKLINVEMVIRDLSFLSPRYHRETGEKIGRGEDRTVFDLSVLIPGRLVFCAKPDVSKAPGYVCADANITLVNEGAGVLDLSAVKLPSAKALAAVKAKTGIEYSFSESRGVIRASSSGELTMDTLIESKGRCQTLGQWAEEMGPGAKLRCEAPFRASSSEAAFIKTYPDGPPTVHDVGVSTTYTIRRSDYLSVMNAFGVVDDDAQTGEIEDDETTAVARTLAAGIRGKLNFAFKGATSGEELPKDFVIPWEPIRGMIGTSFLAQNSGKIHFLNKVGDLVVFSRADAWNFLKQTFGEVYSPGKVRKYLEDADIKGRKADDMMTLFSAIAAKTVMDHISLYRQRLALAWLVDPFINTPHFELREFDALITIPHRPYPTGPVDEAVIADFRAHWAEVDDFLDFIAAARFVADRKRTFLWWHASSDFGKGLVTTLLAQLGIVASTSVKEIEAVMEGKPVGLSADTFKRAIILWIDEFKAVKSELKQLQSTIELSPKHQLRQSVPIYTKLFTSAESVGSLVTSNGVEDQFVNRFSLFRNEGSIDCRPMFIKDKAAYAGSLQNWMAAELNRRFDSYIAMGRITAQKASDERVSAFYAAHGIGRAFGRASDSIEHLANEFIIYIRREPDITEQYPKPKAWKDDLVRTEDGYVLKSPRKHLSDWIDATMDRSEAGTFQKKKMEILTAASSDGKGLVAKRLPGIDPVVKGVLLNEPRK